MLTFLGILWAPAPNHREKRTLDLMSLRSMNWVCRWTFHYPHSSRMICSRMKLMRFGNESFDGTEVAAIHDLNSPVTGSLRLRRPLAGRLALSIRWSHCEGQPHWSFVQGPPVVGGWPPVGRRMLATQSFRDESHPQPAKWHCAAIFTGQQTTSAGKWGLLKIDSEIGCSCCFLPTAAPPAEALKGPPGGPVVLNSPRSRRSDIPARLRLRITQINMNQLLFYFILTRLSKIHQFNWNVQRENLCSKSTSSSEWFRAREGPPRCGGRSGLLVNRRPPASTPLRVYSAISRSSKVSKW